MLKVFMGRFSRAAFVCVIAVLVQGCSTLWGPKPDIASEEKNPDRAYSNAEVRRMLVDQPNMLSGDYFRKRTAQESPDMAFRFGEPAPAAADGAVMTATAQWPPKIGLLINTPEISADHAEAIVTAAAEALPPGLILVDPGRLQEVIASGDCQGELDCISRQAALYPGVRILMFAERLQLAESFPGRSVIRFKVIDSELAYGYPPLKLTATVKGAAENDAFLRQACSRGLTDAKRYAEVMPPHARVFSVQNDRIYISAGKRTGVEPGSVLPVVAAGEAVFAPTGIPVGWVPGEPRGSVRVELLIGEDAAACVPVEGGAPVIGDYVLFRTMDR